MKRLAALAAALLLPGAAHACAVCGFVGGNRAAFFWTTVLLSLLPLALVAGGVAYLRRSGRAWMADEFADPDERRPPDGSAVPPGSGT